MKKQILFFSLILIFSCSPTAKKTVRIDGSSTVFPLTEVVADAFRHKHPKIRIAAGVSGTGGGFKKFLNKEIDINEASRKIKKSEQEEALAKGVEYIELVVAYDGIAIVANKDNHWLESLTVKDLGRIWRNKKPIENWNQINPSYPDKKISLYGPGAASGTFDYFTKVINGKAQLSRHDYNHSEDDNILVKGVAGDLYSLGFFGFSYYLYNKEKLKLIALGHPPVKPSFKTIKSTQYKPLSRPLYLYVRKESLKNNYTKQFIKFYLEQVGKLAHQAGFISQNDKVYKQYLKKWF